MNEEQLSSGELRKAKSFLAHEMKRLSKLDKNVDDINLIDRINKNIKLYEEKIKMLEK